MPKVTIKRNGKEYTYFRESERYNGKLYSGTGKTAREASRALDAKIEAAKRGEHAVGGNMTVDAWFARWYRLYKAPTKMTDKSKGMYPEKYNRYIKPRIGQMRLKDVTEDQLQEILNDEADAGRSKSHIQKLRRVMMEMFHKAHRAKPPLINYDPAEDLTIPDAKDGGHRAITYEERIVTEAVAEDHENGLWFLVILYEGLRPSEIAALDCGDIDLKRNEIHVHAALESGAKNIKEPKSEAGKRDLPIHARIRPKLEAAVKDRPPSAPLFTTQSGGRHNSGSMYRMWRSFRRAMHIFMGGPLYRNKIPDGQDRVAEDLTPYCYRHTFCTDLERAGVPINVAKELMGHSDIALTARIYTHKDTGVLHNAIQQLDGTAKNKGEEAQDSRQ